jgi:hypothetical protein
MRALLEPPPFANELVPPNVVLTSYFRSRPDPQRKKPNGDELFVDSDSFDYIYPWYVSMSHAGLHGIIFHDGLSEEFVSRYTTDKIRFLRVTLGGFSTNDERFLIYLYYLEKAQGHEKILMTDVSDVFIKRDPFFMMDGDEDGLWVGQDRAATPTVSSSPWAVNKANAMFQQARGALPAGPDFGAMPLMNAGVVGGTRGAVLKLLRGFSLVFNQIGNANNHNMMALHYVVYRQKMKVRMGYPLTSGFKQYEFNTGACIVHK